MSTTFEIIFMSDEIKLHKDFNGERFNTTANKKDAELYKGDGWVETEPEVDPTLDDIEARIAALESKDDIGNLIKELYGVDVDKRGGIETVREKAIEMIRA